MEILKSPELLEKSKQKVHTRMSKKGKKFTAGSYISHAEILDDLRRAVDYLNHVKKSPTTQPKNEIQKLDYEDSIKLTENRIANLKKRLKETEE